MAIVLLGTLDTKGREFAYVRHLLATLNLQTTLIDAGSLGTPEITADVRREAVFDAAGTTLEFAVLLLLGTMLTLDGLGAPGLWGWLLVPVLLLVIRPLLG